MNMGKYDIINDSLRQKSDIFRVFKLVNDYGYDMWSWNIDKNHNKFKNGWLSIEYEIGVTRFPVVRNSKLFAFADLDSCKSLKAEYKNLEHLTILECETSSFTFPKFDMSMNSFYSMGDLETFWNDPKPNELWIPEDPVSPTGTILCDYLKPIRVIS